MKTGAEENIWT